MTLRPFQLDALFVAKPWGGRRLESLGYALPPSTPIGECWSVADLDEAGTVTHPQTRVASGRHAGRRLAEVIASDHHAVMGASRSVRGRFPLLVKTLDAREHLSVQVHPPSTYVRGRTGVAAKTETWVVLDADADAELFIGLRDGVSLEDVEARLGTPDLVSLLRRVRAVPGEVHHLPAGLVHALGAGIVVAEVQTPSDTTFRLYDWTEEYGRADRELHLAAGLESMHLAWDLNVGPAIAPGGEMALVDTSHYRLGRRRLAAGETARSRSGRARVLLTLEGEVTWDGATAPLHRGGAAVLPAAWQGDLVASEDATVLEVIAA